MEQVASVMDQLTEDSTTQQDQPSNEVEADQQYDQGNSVEQMESDDESEHYEILNILMRIDSHTNEDEIREPPDTPYPL